MRNKITYLNYAFNAKKIARATIGLEQSLPILSLGIDTFETEIKCLDESILQFEQNTPLRYFHRGKQLGIFFVQAIERVSPDHYTFSAISTLGLLEQRNFRGGIYTGETVAEVVSAICGNIPCIIKTSLQSIKLYGWLGIMSARLALQQVLFAIGANLVIDANGVLRIENLWDGISAVLDKDRIYADAASVKQDTPYTSVTVLEHQYSLGSERKDLFKGTTTQGQTIPFDEPMSDLEAHGFTILEQGANYATVSAGSGTLTGVSYIHTTLEVTKPVTNAPVLNDKRIEDATLVSLVNSNAVAERLASYYACREAIRVSGKLQREHPGQVVQIHHPYERKMVQATLSSSLVNVSGVLKSDIVALVGFTPPQDSADEYYDERVVLTGAGDWIPPEGVKEITVVAIGKGESGIPGQDGQAGTSSSLWVTSAAAEKGGSWSANPADGGLGGEAGAGGLGGKINRRTLKVAGGTPISYDATGNDAIFGDITSADGTASAGGYVDPITGEQLAISGLPGVAGAPGGKGGNASLNTAKAGENGGDVLDSTGGVGGVPWSTDTSGNFVQKIRRAGGGGGGAAKGMNGLNAVGYNSPGGGADADAPESPTTLGQGGYGGNGGGGGGGGAGAYYACNPPENPSTQVSGIGWTSTGGKPGKGSPGSEGGPAGIILYFRRKKGIRQAMQVDRNLNFILDSTGRLVIG